MSKLNLLGATMHTAGIFSDMTVDGPEIGTLVVVVDRAKNLPNRKTIGKQDPYCAARLGKEAKKTETDRRGGQTPRWDQEMRFTVHDSPDYYQLKVSVFNDDKKTEIIGETWISLTEVVVPGGGKNDLWHQLNCKGKYAGEIRIEITYYDTRPKPEKVQEKKKQVAAVNDTPEASRDPMSGPRQMKAVKRRPLPSNPTSASPSPARPAAPVADQSPVPARGRPLPSSERAFDHSSSQSSSHSYTGGRALPAPDYVQDQSPASAPTRGRALPAPEQVPEYAQTPPRGRQLPHEYQSKQPHPQHIDYNTPPPRYPPSTSNRHSQYNTNGYHSSPAPLALASAPNPAPLPVNDRYDGYDQAPPGNEYFPGNALARHDDSMNGGDVSPLMSYHAEPDPNHYALPPPEEYDPLPSPGGPPPPPPRHGARPASPLPPPPTVAANETWDMPNFGSNANAVVPANHYEGHMMHGRPMQPYAHAKSYEAYTPPREQHRPQSRDQRPPSRDPRDQRPQSRGQEIPFRHNSFDDRRDQRPQSRDQYDNVPRHHSLDNRYDQRPQSRGQYENTARHNSLDNRYDQRPQSRGQYESISNHNSLDNRYQNGYESMQPTVEDAPPSPGLGALTHPRSGSFTQAYDDRRYDQVPSPAPLNLNSRGSVGRQSVSTQSTQLSNGYASSASRGSPVSFATQNSSVSSRQSYNMNQYQPPRRRESEDRMGGSGSTMPMVPTSLVAGMDPMIAQEISAAIYSDKRGDKRGSFNNGPAYPRNGYHPEPPQAPYQQERPTSSYGRQNTGSVFVPASAPSVFSQQSMGPVNGSMRERSPAPMGSQRNTGTVIRKSVSPAPPARDRSRSPAPPERRLSGIPFGPDDYEALNPNVASKPSKPGLPTSNSGVSFSDSIAPKREISSNEKIISHDGREIDPSDYLPVDTYAAEYEKKVKPKEPLQTAASLALARPRSQGRPYSMVPASNSSVYMITPTTNASPGRARLQKKSARQNQQAPTPMSNSVGPLAPINPYQDNGNFNPRALMRTSTGDMANENYDNGYGRDSSRYRGGSAPPIPDKVPYDGRVMGGVGGRPQQQQQIDHGEQAWNLLEEMKSIDLGTGNSRARGTRKGW